MAASPRLPDQWRTCVLGDLLQRIQTGKSVRCDERPPTTNAKGLVKISAVTRGEFDENESKTLLADDHLLPNQKINVGDLLISRANTLELVGACAMVNSLSKELYLSDKVLRLAMDCSFKPLVLRYLKTRDARGQIESLATGNQLSMRNISQEAIRAIKLPLPPLAEQKVIADKLDTLLAQVENTKARLERIPQILKRFRQSVLSAAVSGRLTEEWRNGAEFEVESGALGNFVSIDIGHAFKSKEFTDQGVSLLRGQNIEPGALRWSETKYFPEAKLSEFRHLFINADDIVLAMDRPIISSGLKVARAKSSDLPCVLVQRVARFRSFNDLLPDYLYALLQDISFTNYIQPNQTGSDIPHISGKQILAYPVAIPNIEEQTEIVRRVDLLFARANRIEQQVNNALARVNNLTQSILAKAFRGELTEQWREDNPELISGENSAEALLERIKLERAAAKPAKKARKRAPS